MKKLLITMKYDGTAYHGWQVQKNALSVQEVFQDAVEKVFLSRLDVVGCSRTDAGVHANCYCLTLETEMDITDEGVILALNTRLPDDIAVIDCREVAPDFHARYSCQSKEYLYCVYNGQRRDPFRVKYAYHYRRPIDADLLNEEAKAFLGTHDFAGFCAAGSDVGDTVRTVTAFDVWREGEMVYFKVAADGFLYNMVRIMVGTLLFVNEGKIRAGELPNIIRSKERSRAGRTAQPQGLYLNRVNY